MTNASLSVPIIPHAEGFIERMKKARKLLSGLPTSFVEKDFRDECAEVLGDLGRMPEVAARRREAPPTALGP